MEYLIVKNLKDLKKNIPENYSAANAKKLYSRLLELQYLIARLPVRYAQLQNKHENNVERLKLRIDTIFSRTDQHRLTKNFYKEAFDSLHLEVDSIIPVLDLHPDAGKVIPCHC